MTPEQQNLARRILKLLALADGSPFEAEASSARNLAEQLRSTHGIDLTAAQGVGSLDRDRIEKRTYDPFAKGAQWEALIFASLGQLCSCLALFPALYNVDRDPEPDRGAVASATMTAVGAVADLDVMFFMLPELHRQRMRAWVDYKATRGGDNFYKFCFGYARALEAKIDQIRDRDQWRQRRAALIAWVEATEKRKLGTWNVAHGKASSQAGLEAGGNASLHRGNVGHTPTRRITYRG